MIRRILSAFALGIALCGLTASSARAQGGVGKEAAPPPPPAEGDGEPIYGYLGMGVFGAIVIMAVCKSSRRSM